SRGQNLTMRLFVEQPTLDAAPSGTSPQHDGMRQQMNYEFEMESAYLGQAHRISVLTVYAFILFTLVCVGFIYMASVAISFLAVLILSSLLGTGFEIGRGGKKIWGTPGHIVVPLKARGTKFDYKRESERKTFTR